MHVRLEIRRLRVRPPPRRNQSFVEMTHRTDWVVKPREVFVLRFYGPVNPMGHVEHRACHWVRLQLTRDLCDYFNYFFSTNIIADQSPTSCRTIGDSFCMPSVIDRRLVAVGLQLVKSDRRPVGNWLQSNGDWSETCWRPFCDQNKILINCYDMDEFISVQVVNMII